MPGFAGEESQAPVAHSERIALNDAASALADQPWGKVEDSGLVTVLFGRLKETEEDRVLDQYISRIRTFNADPVTAVIADADSSLAQARRVAEAGRQAVNSMQPVASDISTLEDAISEARECRKMYVRALQLLQKDGAAISESDVDMIRDAFTQTIADIGQTADVVADRVALGENKDRLALPTTDPVGGSDTYD
ncbi:hypothetical protein [Parvularcula sp. LCG005]|uniref:hypothetical protein n=1 Tax=Parvularcula sp. LCG005 TaxID=3078805 RepID=UPI0029429275|nr:hypothetical protein [Parvularcula sp. LCG005]WOI54122.1 hypothetical protein RUI03_03755 [Parvularcula sp. LCG005]